MWCTEYEVINTYAILSLFYRIAQRVAGRSSLNIQCLIFSAQYSVPARTEEDSASGYLDSLFPCGNNLAISQVPILGAVERV